MARVAREAEPGWLRVGVRLTPTEKTLLDRLVRIRDAEEGARGSLDRGVAPLFRSLLRREAVRAGIMTKGGEIIPERPRSKRSGIEPRTTNEGAASPGKRETE